MVLLGARTRSPINEGSGQKKYTSLNNAVVCRELDETRESNMLQYENSDWPDAVVRKMATLSFEGCAEKAGSLYKGKAIWNNSATSLVEAGTP